MALPNNILLLCNRANADHCLCSEQCRRQCIEDMVMYRQEDALSNELEFVINFEEDHLNDLWRVTVQRLVTGYSLYIKATRRSYGTSFGPAMNNFPFYMAIMQQQRTKRMRPWSMLMSEDFLYQLWKAQKISTFNFPPRKSITYWEILKLQFNKFNIQRIKSLFPV